jgi:hypothetical protein
MISNIKLAQPQSGWQLVNAETHIGLVLRLVNAETHIKLRKSKS